LVPLRSATFKNSENPFVSTPASDLFVGQHGGKMNARFKSAFKYAGTFFLGLLAGMLLLESVEIYVRPAYRNLIRTRLKVEQEFLASRAARDNKPLESAFHRWVVVSTESEDGFHALRGHSDEINDKSYLFPLALLKFKWMSSTDSVRKGEKIVEGLDRGKLAVALEALGQAEEADKQWQQAQHLMGRPTMEATKKSVYSILAQEKSDSHLNAEDAVLGRQKK
jgi:hypothetical protein